MKRSIALSCTSPRSALTTEYGSMTPILMFSARAGTASKSPSAAHPSMFHNRICILPGYVLLGPPEAEVNRGPSHLSMHGQGIVQSIAAVKPGERIIPIPRAFAAHYCVAQERVSTSGMINMIAECARLKLHAGRAQQALQAVALKRRFDALGIRGGHMRKAHRILHRHAGALRKILHHRMGCVAEEGNPAVDPILDGIAIAEHPQPPVRAVPDDLLRALVHVLEALEHLRLGHRLAGNRLGRVVVICDNEIEDLPALQGIMHDVTLRPRP